MRRDGKLVGQFGKDTESFGGDGRRGTLTLATFARLSLSLLEDAVTRICSLEHIEAMESAFAIIAEPNRRAIRGTIKRR
jgi:hypothetical protein